MPANPVAFSPLAIARAKLVVLGYPGVLVRRIVDSVRSLKDSEHISVGRLLADEISRRTPVGVQCERALRVGVPFPDDAVLAVVRRWFWSRKTSRGFVLEGFPASVAQALVFDEWLESRDESLTACIWVDQSENDSVLEAGATLICPRDGSIYVSGIDAQVVPGCCNFCRTPLVAAGEEGRHRVRSWYARDRRSLSQTVDYYRTQSLLETVPPGAPTSVDETTSELLARVGALVADR